MKVPPILQRRRALRWLAPAGVVCVAGLAATGMFKASASSESLPDTTPAALIAAVQSSDVAGLSGTVVSQLSLGLPELPDIGNAGGGTSFTSLLAGSHTLQVWYGGIAQQRIALLGATDETDVFRNGTDMWQWSSADKTAVHAQLPALSAPAAPVPAPGSSAVTPAELAHDALAALDPSTRVAVSGGHSVADRSAYQLVLTPRTTATKVGSVHIDVDGDTKVPLGVQIYARNASAPAVDVAFTNIRFARQPVRNFVFSPPPNAAVRELSPSASSGGAPSVLSDAGDAHAAGVRTTGSGWTTVLAVRPSKKAMADIERAGLLKTLTPVAGSWGKGRLLDSALLSVLITTDGRVFSGAVEPDQLYAAAGAK